MLDLDDVITGYAEAFQLYFDGAADAAADAVADLGARVRERGGSLESLVEIHTACFGRIAEKTDPLSAGKVLFDSWPLLVKAVMGYAMNYCMNDVVGSLAAQLEEQQSRARAAGPRLHEDDEFRTLFQSPISHELRNPLNSIIGFTNILLNEWAGPLTPEQKEELALILSAGKKLLLLINDLVDIGRIESGVTKPNLREVVVREAIRDGFGKAAEGIFRIDSSAAPERIVTDDRRLVQALESIAAAVSYLAAEEADLTVQDDGSGGMSLELTFRTKLLTTEECHKLFQPLFRLPGADPAQGLGLSLSLARVTVRDLLGGTLDVAADADDAVKIMLTVPGVPVA